MIKSRIREKFPRIFVVIAICDNESIVSSRDTMCQNTSIGFSFMYWICFQPFPFRPVAHAGSRNNSTAPLLAQSHKFELPLRGILIIPVPVLWRLGRRMIKYSFDVVNKMQISIMHVFVPKPFQEFIQPRIHARDSRNKRDIFYQNFIQIALSILLC